MASFDSFDYDIKSRLPEWWKSFGALEPINEYTQILISEIIESLLSSTGIVQPLNCWLTIPEEYNWYHHYYATDDFLWAEQPDGKIIKKGTTTLFKNEKTIAILPNTKRKCHAKIKLKLEGSDITKNQEGEIVDSFDENENIELLTIKNGTQKIEIKNLKTVSTIEILTETNQILIDGKEDYNFIEGNFGKIQPTIKNPDFYVSYIDENGYKQYKTYFDENEEEKYQEIGIEDENKETKIIIESSKNVNFDLQIYLLKPTYTTEQNIRIATVSAFPIEWVRLYGYFCHPFNNKSGYEFLWEKNYSYSSRTTYDRITKQFDCERFYIQVKFHGIGTPLSKGFPQLYDETNPIFRPNSILDKWGKVFGLPRRLYRTDITEDEEPFTFPRYYSYSNEQDFWYEERMVNEYRYNDEAINTLFVRDSNFKNIATLKCIYPFMNNIWVYTETISPTDNIEHEIKNLRPRITQDLDDVGVKWGDNVQLPSKNLFVRLNPTNDNTSRLNDNSNESKKIKLSFCLAEKESEVPKNIIVKGIELKLLTKTNTQASQITLGEDSNIIIPFISPKNNEPILEKININIPNDIWIKERDYYSIGGKNFLFDQKEITREQLFNGNEGKLEFELEFINKNSFVETTLFIEDILLNIYYEEIQSDYDIKVSFDSKEINISENKNEVSMKIDIENKEKVKVQDKTMFFICSPELQINPHIEVSSNEEFDYEKEGKYYKISDYNSFNFNLDINEKFTIDNIIITPQDLTNIRSGKYDILVICEDNIIKNEILIRGVRE